MTLPEYIQSKIQIPFEWGVNDCMTFTVGWIENVTGKKYLPTPIWKSEIQAMRRIIKEGGIDSAFDKKFKQVNPNYALDGDVCVIEKTAGIISGRNVLTIAEGKGFITLPRRLVVNVWRAE